MYTVRQRLYHADLDYLVEPLLRPNHRSALFVVQFAQGVEVQCPRSAGWDGVIRKRKGLGDRLGSVLCVRSLHGCPLATCDRMSFWLSAHLETVRTHAVSDRLFRIM